MFFISGLSHTRAIKHTYVRTIKWENKVKNNSLFNEQILIGIVALSFIKKQPIELCRVLDKA